MNTKTAPTVVENDPHAFTQTPPGPRRPTRSAADLTALARRIGSEVLDRWADDVDRDARFPVEAMAALREARLLGAMVPVELGGEGVALPAICSVITELAQHCASTAMIFAMHQIQVACLIEHGRSAPLRQFLSAMAADQLLLASATTEVGTGGDVRSSTCAVKIDGPMFRLVKLAPVISYGQYADAIMVTARRTVDSPPSDQSLVVVNAGDAHLEPTSAWDTFGFRGTCSLGFRLTAHACADMIMPAAFAEISSRTMLPVSHLTWSSLWLGLATAAAGKARRFVQAEARKKPGSLPPGAIRLAELNVLLQRLREPIHALGRRFAAGDEDDLAGLDFAVAMNTLKVSSSMLLLDVVSAAMGICGLAGYRQDSPYSLGRLLRDAHGGAVMVNNDRILTNNAQLLLVLKEDR